MVCAFESRVGANATIVLVVLYSSSIFEVRGEELVSDEGACAMHESSRDEAKL